MKSLQIVAHTTGGEVRSSLDQVTERDYENTKTELLATIASSTFIEFDTDEGWVIVPINQLLYLEVKLS